MAVVVSACFLPPVMDHSAPPEESRVKQVLVGLVAIFMVCGLIALGWAGRMLPGFIGEWFGVVIGIVTTPVLMEASFIVLGLMIVITINYWRQWREGDELVYLEQAEGPGSESLPEEARWALYREKPLEPESPTLLAQAEGALEIGDYASVLEALTEMSDDERDSEPVIHLRIKLARATGKHDLAERLEQDLSASPDH